MRTSPVLRASRQASTGSKREYMMRVGRGWGEGGRRAGTRCHQSSHVSSLRKRTQSQAPAAHVSHRRHHRLAAAAARNAARCLRLVAAEDTPEQHQQQTAGDCSRSSAQPSLFWFCSSGGADGGGGGASSAQRVPAARPHLFLCLPPSFIRVH